MALTIVLECFMFIRSSRAACRGRCLELGLLEALREPGNEAAWRRFDERYRPVLLQFGLSVGLERHDAEDAAQMTIVAFCRAYQAGQYHRDKGRFKNWLLGIAQHKIADLVQMRARSPSAVGGRSDSADLLARIRDPESMSAIWERQWQTHIIRECLKRAERNFSSRDIRAFEMLTLSEQSPDQVADALELSRNTVYLIKHRILSFLRGIEVEVGSAE